jgi:hypothetical protein
MIVRLEHTEPAEKIDVTWRGPFTWPGKVGINGLKDLENCEYSSLCGVYLWTVKYRSGYLIYAAGYTKRPFLTRFREHTRAHRDGFFTVFDMEAMQTGRRKEIWHGFFTKKRPLERDKMFLRRRSEIEEAVQNQLSKFRVFLAPLNRETRILKRFEGSIMTSLYKAPIPFSTIPDKGMSLSLRWEAEKPILVRNMSAYKLYGLPDELEI